MAFRFSLATVLRVKESIAEREERALQKIQHEMARVSQQISDLNASMKQAQLASELALQKSMPGGELQSMLWQVQAAGEVKKSLLNALERLEELRVQQMKIYQAAHRDHETLINLCNEQREIYDLEQSRAEQKYLDNIFMARRQRA
jgi:flagellar FliJ protein